MTMPVYSEASAKGVDSKASAVNTPTTTTVVSSRKITPRTMVRKRRYGPPIELSIRWFRNEAACIR
jgi:hypothetical protein